MEDPEAHATHNRFVISNPAEEEQQANQHDYHRDPVADFDDAHQIDSAMDSNAAALTPVKAEPIEVDDFPEGLHDAFPGTLDNIDVGNGGGVVAEDEQAESDNENRNQIVEDERLVESEREPQPVDGQENDADVQNANAGLQDERDDQGEPEVNEATAAVTMAPNVGNLQPDGAVDFTEPNINAEPRMEQQVPGAAQDLEKVVGTSNEEQLDPDSGSSPISATGDPEAQTGVTGLPVSTGDKQKTRITEENRPSIFEPGVSLEDAEATDPRILKDMEYIRTTLPHSRLEIVLTEALKRKDAHIALLSNEVTKLKSFIQKRKQTYKRKRKDNSAPTRPLSAYNIFVQDQFMRLKKQNEVALTSSDTDLKLKRVPPSNLVATTGLQWKELDRNEKAKYEQRAQEDRKRYEEQMASYQTPDQHPLRKRNKTGYNMFFTAHVQNLKHSNQEVPSERGSAAKLVGMAWKNLSKEQRQLYEYQAEQYNNTQDDEEKEEETAEKRSPPEQDMDMQPIPMQPPSPVVHPPQPMMEQPPQVAPPPPVMHPVPPMHQPIPHMMPHHHYYAHHHMYSPQMYYEYQPQSQQHQDQSSSQPQQHPAQPQHPHQYLPMHQYLHPHQQHHPHHYQHPHQQPHSVSPQDYPNHGYGPPPQRQQGTESPYDDPDV